MEWAHRCSRMKCNIIYCVQPAPLCGKLIHTSLNMGWACPLASRVDRISRVPAMKRVPRSATSMGRPSFRSSRA